MACCWLVADEMEGTQEEIDQTQFGSERVEGGTSPGCFLGVCLL